MAILKTFLIPAFTVCFFLHDLSCSSKRKISFHISGKRYYISYDRHLTLPMDKEEIELAIETNFPGQISLAISSGIFGKVSIVPMECYELKCVVNLKRGQLFEETYFWFILETELGYYSVPNRLVHQDIFEVLGKITLSDR